MNRNMVEQFYIPDTGDIAWMLLDVHSGHEQAGRRPVLVITGRKFNATLGLCFVCPITSQIKGFPFEVVLPQSGLIKGVVLLDHMKSLDWHSREITFIEKAPISVIQNACTVLKLIIP